MRRCFELDQSDLIFEKYHSYVITHTTSTTHLMKNTPTSVSKKPQFEFLSHEDIEKLYHHYALLDPQATTHGVSVSHLLSLPGAKENPLAKRIMECFDENGDGNVDFEEFVNGLAVFSSRGHKNDKIKFAFDIYDIDKDGYISNGELFLTLKIMSGDHLEDIHLQQVVDKTIRDADEDGDGRISFEEFKKLVETRNSDVLDKWTLTDL